MVSLSRSACPRTLTTILQTVTGTITFEGFGATIATTGSSSNPYKFAATSGYRDDGDAGLAHVGARYYDSQVGRFITRDTELDQKPYLYCEHDAVNHLDPSGHNIPVGPIQDKNKPGEGWGGIALLTSLAIILVGLFPPADLVIVGVGAVAVVVTAYNLADKKKLKTSH